MTIRGDIYPTEPGTSKADGYPGHFISASECMFRLHHHVLSLSGERFRVSTVGHSKSEINASGLPFETCVFSEHEIAGGYLDANWTEICRICTDHSIAATAQHYQLVEEYLAK
jgi:hypothetical protein